MGHGEATLCDAVKAGCKRAHMHHVIAFACDSCEARTRRVERHSRALNLRSGRQVEAKVYRDVAAGHYGKQWQHQQQRLVFPV